MLAFRFLAATFGFAVAMAAGLGHSFLRRVSGEHVALVVVLAAAVAAALTSPAAATGTPLVDGGYRAMTVGLATYLGSRLRLPVLAVATAAAAALSAGRGGAALAAAVAAGVLLGWRGLSSGSDPSPPRGPAAVTAACCALSLLQPGATLPGRLSALGSALVLVVVFVLGYRRAPDVVRRRFRLALLGAAGLAIVAGGLGVVAMAQARSSLEAGVASATRATAEARQLDSQAASRSMQTSAGRFDRAHAKLRSPLGRFGAVVPLLSQQVRALREASASGVDLARAGLVLTEAVDQDTLRIIDGRIPLERLKEAQPKAVQAEAAIAAARGDLARLNSPWLLPQLRRRLDRVQDELQAAGERADQAAAVLADIPPLLGSKGPRRYFVAVQTPSELRGSGGFMGSFAEVAVEDGRLALGRTGRPLELNADPTTPVRTLDAPADFVARYSRFDLASTWESVTISPHFPSDAQVIRSLYPQSGGLPVNAVVAIDPFAIQAILQVVGPIRVPGAPKPLTGENAARFLLFEQYEAFGDADQEARHDFLAGAIRALAERLLGGDVAIGPLAQVLQPMVDQKHLMVSAGAATEEPVFDRLGLTGAMAPVEGDALGVVVQNAGASKIDWFLRRKIDYEVTVDPRSGSLAAEATIKLSNEAPADGLPHYMIGNLVGLPLGTSRMYVSFYSALLLQRASLDGQPLLLESETEQGRYVYSAYVDVPAGATSTIVLNLAGTQPTDRPYRLDLHRQPSAAEDQVTVSLLRSGTAGSAVRRDIRLTTDTVFEAPLSG